MTVVCNTSYSRISENIPPSREFSPNVVAPSASPFIERDVQPLQDMTGLSGRICPVARRAKGGLVYDARIELSDQELKVRRAEFYTLAANVVKQIGCSYALFAGAKKA